MLKGRGHTCFEVVLTWELEDLAILKGGATSFNSLKGGGGVLPCIGGGRSQTVLNPQFSHFVCPPPHN